MDSTHVRRRKTSLLLFSLLLVPSPSTVSASVVSGAAIFSLSFSFSLSFPLTCGGGGETEGAGCGEDTSFLLKLAPLWSTYGLFRSIGGSNSRLIRSVQSMSSKKACFFKALTPPMQNIVLRDAPSRLFL